MIDNSQGSVATHFGCGGILAIIVSQIEYISRERIFSKAQYLMQL